MIVGCRFAGVQITRAGTSETVFTHSLSTHQCSSVHWHVPVPVPAVRSALIWSEPSLMEHRRRKRTPCLREVNACPSTSSLDGNWVVLHWLGIRHSLTHTNCPRANTNADGPPLLLQADKYSQPLSRLLLTNFFSKGWQVLLLSPQGTTSAASAAAAALIEN